MKRMLLALSMRRLVEAIVLLSLFAMAVRATADTDTWWHLQAGRVMWERGQILQTDLFSHTRYGAHWVNHSWLSQMMLYWLFNHFSYAGLGLWMGAAVTASFFFVYLQMEGDPYTRAFIVVLAAATSGVIWSVRPQLMSFLLTAVVAYVLYLLKWRGVNRLWVLPPLFVVWVNLHAGYALGFMVLVGFVCGEALNHLLAVFAPSEDPVVDWRGIGKVVGVGMLSAVVLVVNPNTIRMWTYYVDTVAVQVLQDFIQEWQSPDFHPLYTQPFIWMLLATLASMGLSGRRADGTDLVLISIFAYAALLAGRNIGPFALVTAPVLSRHVRSIRSQWGRALHDRGWLRMPAHQNITPTRALVNWAILMLVGVLAFVKISQPLDAAFNRELHRESLPVDAADWIWAHRPEGKVFNHYNWGGYLIWRLWPEYLVFVDGRTDLYGDEILKDYLEIQRAGPRALTLLEQYDISIVMTTTDDALGTLLGLEPSWELVYRDITASIWKRADR